MKKIIAILLAAVMLMGCASAMADGLRVAMITDVGTITDQSFNQTTYEAAKAWSEANGVDFTYYQPADDTDAARIAQIEKAIDDDYNVLVLPGYKFGPAIGSVQEENADVKFIALDVSEGDLGGVALGSNVYCAVYQEELCGYMAGYAAVKLGYKHLGFLGGMAVPAVIRYGFGFVQGVDAAAVELGIADQGTVEYVYGGQFYGDGDITSAMDTWYQSKGVEVVFACGGGIYTSAAEAAQKVNGKVIGVDVDQAATIDGAYGEGMTVTSAMKGLGATVNTLLSETAAGNWDNFGGKVETLGLVGVEPEANYVQIAPSTQFADGFTAEDYAALVAKMFNGEVTVSNAIEAMPATSVTVVDAGSIK
jgi:basic membrane protein A